MKETIAMRRSICHFRPDDVPVELIEQRAFPKSILRDIRVIIDKTTIHYILSVLPKNSTRIGVHLPQQLQLASKVDIEGASVVAYVKLVLQRTLENAI